MYKKLEEKYTIMDNQTLPYWFIFAWFSRIKI